MSKLLQDKVVMVSGVGPGLGIQMALLAAAQGARIVLATLEQQDLETAQTALTACSPATEVLALRNDIRERAQCRGTMDATKARFGRLDVLLNSAYVAGAWEPIESAQIEQWPRTLQTNLLGTLTMTQEAIACMKATGGGSIVMVNTMVVRNRPMAGNAEYDASKAALASVTGNLALEVGRYGIRVNSVFMGWMWGPSVIRHLESLSQDSGRSVEDLRGEIERDIPLGRMPTDIDCARAIMFLGSDQSVAITGASLDVNGGQFIPR